MSKLTLNALTLLALLATAAAQNPSPDFLTGLWHGQPIVYQLVTGRAIFQGDIILGHVDPAGFSSGTAPASHGPIAGSVGTAYQSYLWPKVAGVATVYYTIHSGSGDVSNINAAITQFNSDFTGIIQWMPRTTQTVYVDIN